MSPQRGRKPQKAWSANDLALLWELREVQGIKSWRKVAEHFPGRTAGQCEARYYYCARRSRTPVADKPAPQQIKASPQQRADASAREIARQERDENYLRRGSVTPMFFGDPPPGYSALDRKRASA